MHVLELLLCKDKAGIILLLPVVAPNLGCKFVLIFSFFLLFVCCSYFSNQYSCSMPLKPKEFMAMLDPHI